jgi:ketol-acid reductoisomerase
VFAELYESVETGNEARIVIEANSKPDYREKLEAELAEMENMEIWQAGKQVRSLRPENK